MKLLNRSLLYLSVTFLIIIGVWSVIFYFNLKNEIRDSIDDGLDNNRILIIKKLEQDTSLLSQNEFGGNNFEIHPTSKQIALEFKDIYKDTLMYRINEDDLEPVRILHSAFKHKNTYYHLKVISSLVEEDDLIEDSFWSVVWLFIILIATIFIINNVIIRKVWNPFYDILNRLKAYRLDKNEAVINVETKTKEFIELQNASNTLIKHSKDVFSSQKQFTENASHELQTPLAIITNKLELLLESKNLTDADAQTIADVINSTQKLTQLNKSLLLLAKIENKQFANTTSVSVNSTVTDFISSFQDFIDFKNITIEIEEKATLIVNLNVSLLEILITNLIKNAVFHNKNNGTITVIISNDKFTIYNTGNNTALNPKTIFNRFQKEASSTKSTGIGLAVCKAICKLYTTPINYSYSKNQHCFTVNFKNIISTD
ncbi:HAMP domain-containing histidine kinase [Lutibacter sp. A80]|uniref:sensor histidine kinase n=1 Tax=Lutibacter sp. A80 TaxID=2918453 RepID=UPI001F054506|nr:HAMP domain-containing sensor histidine kinase [Lutibacter sp. A80]UMB61311.1 HAMP domain-containing histidine kinase [Lutibacter sp. A80]